ncbi:HAD-IC family P-type ATPase [Pseudomonas thivervalensis]|uniref:Carbonate dehydratase n=1 Tax=Pseudomonas thivervalensis TaxID=86265 RepID=A0A2Z4Z8R2_9PSED|nr:HAD-IC family P-type ATPase [Pseudomonas thivervalensis]AXA54323.1 hypothetical protein CE140_08110 [Pseudomonas thivervalensis]AXA60003.1 hypothetical protein CEQ51_07950 [Pseudomonas thivervalensis]
MNRPIETPAQQQLIATDVEAWHALSAEQVLEQLDVNEQAGLDVAQVQARLARSGFNRLPESSRRPAWRRFLLQFHNILIYVLLGSAVITAILQHLWDTAVILAVVVVNAVIGYIQEGKAEKAMDAIREMLVPRAMVIRSGERLGIAGDELVPGDIVLLEAGDKVPADLRLLHANRLQVQEAILTGESAPVEKHTEPVRPQAPLGDRACMAFSGTLVTCGQATGVVVATATSAEIGRISNLLADVESLTTPLNMNVISAKDIGESYQMLESGRAIAFMQDDALLAGEMAKAKNPEDWVVTGTPQSNEIYGCTMRRGDPALKKIVDDSIKSLFVSGEINAIYDKWFNQPIPPRDLNLKFPMSTELKTIIAHPNDQPAPERNFP